MTKYRVSHGILFASIKQYEVVKETGKQITYLNDNSCQNKELKVGRTHTWVDDPEEGKRILLEKANRMIKNAEYRMEEAKRYLDKVKTIEIL